MLALPSLLWSEIRRLLAYRWSYRFDTLGEMALWLVAFPAMMAIFAGVSDRFDTRQQLASLIGFLVWDLCMSVLSGTTREIAHEAEEGTLESLFLSPLPPIQVIFLRVLAAFLVQGMHTLVLGMSLVYILNLPILWSNLAPALLLFTVAGVFGLSLALGGLAIVYKQIANVIGAVTLLMVLATGALIPLDRLGALFRLLRLLVPTTWGIHALRAALLEGVTWQVLWQNGTWVGLGTQALLLLGLGAAIFHWGYQRARSLGILGSY